MLSNPASVTRHRPLNMRYSPALQVSALRSLAELSLGLEPLQLEGERVGDETLRPLRQLSALTKLDLSCCGADACRVRAMVGPRVLLTCW